MKRKIINPWSWQDQFGFVQGNHVSDASQVLYCSGQTSLDADGNPLHPGDMEAQLRLALDNLETILAEAGMGFKDVVRLNYYTTDTNAFIQSMPEALERLKNAECRPSSIMLGIDALFHPDILVEIEATATR